MTSHVDVWQFVGGIGLFLFAMSQMESALNQFAGRPLKNFLRRHTGNALKSIAMGTVSTAIVQSSSLVGLMVLAFVGASVMSLPNALGVIFGANLGTTLTGWIVATLGFKLEVTGVALPMTGIGALLLALAKGRVAEFGRIILALGFLLMGISLMKSGVAAISETFDVTRLGGLSLWQYLVFGVLFAAIVQSSSAAMMVTLAALHTGVIELPAGAAIAVGADLGTTSTVLIGAVNGAVGKKRVAFAHVIFNATTTVIAFAFLMPLLAVIQAIGIQDTLYSLVAFHSLFNLIGILIFVPFMKPFARFLERRLSTTETNESQFVSATTSAVPEAAILAIAEETASMITRVIHQNLSVFDPPIAEPSGLLPVKTSTQVSMRSWSYDEMYRRNKKLEGEIVNFTLKVQIGPLEGPQTEWLNRCLAAVRHAIHSAKSLRDVRHNLDAIGHSPHDDLFAYHQRFKGLLSEFYAELYKLRADQDTQFTYQDMDHLITRIEDWHDRLHGEIFADIRNGQLADSDISSLLNVNRELMNSNIALVAALQDFSLVDANAIVLRELPNGS